MTAPPPLKADPKYGSFLRWPQDGDDWLHPDDVALVRTLLPSPRIFSRDGVDGEVHRFHYGNITFRAKPALWQEVTHEGFDIGDWVEVLSRGMRNEPRTGVVREMLWDDHKRMIHYQIAANDVPIADLYTRDDLQHVDPV